MNRAMSPLLGAHMSIAGGVETAPERGKRATCDIIQIFTKNSNQWFAPPLKDSEIAAFKANMKQYGIRVAIAHDAYLINLCAAKTLLWKQSFNAFVEELKRAEALELAALVFHPGAHTGAGEAYGIKKMIESLNGAHDKTPGFKVKTAIEITAGQGTVVGYRFEQIAAILGGVEDKKRMGVCFDTQHAFAAGYDLRTEEGYEKVMDEFDKIIGLKKIVAFHLNDSKKECGSRVDRHEHIGKGAMGLIPFRCLMNDRRFEKIPMSLETPKDEDMKEDRMNLKVLRGLIKKQ